MELFDLSLNKCENLGISANQRRLNGKLLIILTAYWANNTLNCMFCVRNVNTFNEMANSIYIVSTTTAISTCFTILVAKKLELFRLIDGCKKTIAKRN